MDYPLLPLPKPSETIAGQALPIGWYLRHTVRKSVITRKLVNGYAPHYWTGSEWRYGDVDKPTGELAAMPASQDGLWFIIGELQLW